MERLRFTRLPERGDAVLGVKGTNNIVFLKAESFSGLSDIDQDTYEPLGTIFKRDGNIVKWINIENASKTWCERYSYKLSVTVGATSGVISIRQASDSWAANHQYTISWTNAFADDATHRAEVVAALNAFFAANDPFTANLQDWKAEEVDGQINVHFYYQDWRQAGYNTASSGFGFTANLLPEIPALANMLRKHGGTGGEGAISSWERALAYFRQDLNSSTYNPTSTVTSIKTTYPVCLPGYLGTSQYSGGDRCALLRETYGPGEAGWLKYMESCKPVYPTDWGNMGMTPEMAERWSGIMAAKIYSSQKRTNEPMCKAAYYCANVEHATTPKGTFRLPTTQEVAEILDGVQYGTNNSRNSDILNETQAKLQGSAVSNGSLYWSCFRYSGYSAWGASGSTGFFGNGGMYYGYLAVPVSLYDLRKQA